MSFNLEKAGSMEKMKEDFQQQSRPRQKQRMFSHPFSFHGRIRRLEYGLSYIAYMIWFSIFNVVGEDDSAMAILYLMTFIPAVWFMLAQRAKRCHDRDNSGWYQIIPFYDLWILFGDGDEYENTYGADPKGRDIFE